MTLVIDTALAAAVVIYLWRFRRLRLHTGKPAKTRLLAFVAGSAFLWTAMASPISHFDTGHLTAHMLQHLLIMTVAAPLLLWSDSLYVFSNASDQLAKVARARWPRPAVCWFAGTFVVLFWHVPSAFAFGMRWHAFQHSTFLVAALLFWLPVCQPWPSVATGSRWSIPLYLFFAALPCDGLSAFLAFCGRVVYPQYAAMDPSCSMLHGQSALVDQQRAGALMWFWVTFAYLAPAALITVELLSRNLNASNRARLGADHRWAGE